MTYLPTHDPRVTATLDILTDALLAAFRAGHERTATAEHAAADLQHAAQQAVLNLARDLVAEHGAVAS